MREHVVRVRPSKHLQKRARRYANEAPFSLLTFFTLSVAPRISVVSRPYLLSFAVAYALFAGDCRRSKPFLSVSTVPMRVPPSKPPLTPFSKATGLARDLAVIPLCAQLPLISVGPLELIFNITRR